MKLNLKMVVVISAHLKYHNSKYSLVIYLDLIDNIADHVDFTRDQMARQTNQINLVERKDRTCGE